MYIRWFDLPPVAMFPSKADRILSRYRPIAPKLPLPIPPSAPSLHAAATTDLSSTCASLDSFASSSSKIRRTRKRRIAPASSPAANKCPKTRKSELPLPQVVSTFSNTNNGISISSLTQGNSDGAVPGINLSHTSPSHTVRERATATTQANRMMDVADRARVPIGEPSIIAAPFHPHSLVEQARMLMVVDALKARQPSMSPHPLHLKGYPAMAMNMERDVAFMERAAASSVLPEKGTPSDSVSCNAVCMKGVGYAGGGFTEMIRGITRLPTVADVQTLMHVRSGTTGAVAVASPGASSPTTESLHSSPSRRELHQQRPELQCQTPGHLLQASLLPLHVDDCTLPLLPSFPSKHSLRSETTLDAVFPVNHGAHVAELPADVKCRPDCEGPASHLSASSCPIKDTGSITFGSRSPCGSSKQLQQERDNAEALSLSPPSQTTSPLVLLPGLAVPSTLNDESATVDHVYLQQVYGGSTDPILLVDDSCQALWSNRAYERASKSVLDRLSNKPSTVGPYIDPLGHPTPLGRLVLNSPSGTFKPVNATLWGFLRKLVTPIVNTSPSLAVRSKEEHVRDIDTGRLCESGARVPRSTSEVWSNSLSVCRIDDAKDAPVCASMGKLTTVTLESITEVHQGQGPAFVECVEMAEARLRAPGSVPAFITDCTSRVRWVNAAFKQMLGQPEQQSSSKLMGIHLAETSAMQNDPPDLTFVGAAEKIPWSAGAFSGLVNLEWMKAGRRRSMTVPCDVSRLAPAATWVWKFDVALSLSLNLCT
ncbi:hypothetical protein L7F22_040522 [Adiantum nelumboides]|nr:hypothetical protein [Adiantum nelumboides]